MTVAFGWNRPEWEWHLLGHRSSRHQRRRNEWYLVAPVFTLYIGWGVEPPPWESR